MDIDSCNFLIPKAPKAVDGPQRGCGASGVSTKIVAIGERPNSLTGQSCHRFAGETAADLPHCLTQAAGKEMASRGRKVLMEMPSTAERKVVRVRAMAVSRKVSSRVVATDRRSGNELEHGLQ